MLVDEVVALFVEVRIDGPLVRTGDDDDRNQPLEDGPNRGLASALDADLAGGADLADARLVRLELRRPGNVALLAGAVACPDDELPFLPDGRGAVAGLNGQLLDGRFVLDEPRRPGL
jgi:hypothetical protein